MRKPEEDDPMKPYCNPTIPTPQLNLTQLKPLLKQDEAKTPHVAIEFNVGLI
jgi:hypothetical protein